jgi:hypothetical protein
MVSAILFKCLINRLLISSTICLKGTLNWKGEKYFFWFHLFENNFHFKFFCFWNVLTLIVEPNVLSRSIDAGGGGVLGVLAKFCWGGYLGLWENPGGGPLLACFIAFLFYYFSKYFEGVHEPLPPFLSCVYLCV